MDLVMFLVGRVTISDGTAMPHDALVERVCNGRVRQQVYASTKGDFSMQLGTIGSGIIDASGDAAPMKGIDERSAAGGIPRRDLTNCELRASAAGFRSSTVPLMSLSPSESTANVGDIVIERMQKVKGNAINAAALRTPATARKAYEKGLTAESKGKLGEAQKAYEQAIEIYPKYGPAWYRLGLVLEKQSQSATARDAFLKATTLDNKLLPPYLALAAMAYGESNWEEVLRLTEHILTTDPLSYAEGSGYMVDLDETNLAEAYFFNAMANYRLNRIEAAEKSALKAEHVDLRTSFPQLHLLMAEILARKQNYAQAIAELQTYFALVPGGKEQPVLKERLAKLEELKRAGTAPESTVHN